MKNGKLFASSSFCLTKIIIDAWLLSEFQEGESTAKVIQMRELEQKSFHPDNI